MVFPAAVWALLVLFIAWKAGLSEGKLPAPYRFWGATGAMALCALVGLVNSRVGSLMAVALALGAVLYYQTAGKGISDADAISLSGTGSSGTPTQNNGGVNPSSGTTRTNGSGGYTNAVNPATGVPY